MRIQTRLFLGTAMLVLALVAVQWWLHQRQLKAIERELGVVATSVGRGVLAETFQLLGPVPEAAREPGQTGAGYSWVTGPHPQPSGSAGETTAEFTIFIVGDGDEAGKGTTVRRVVRSHVELGPTPCLPPRAAPTGQPSAEVRSERHFELRVVSGGEGERFLVVRSEPGGEKRVPIPVSPTVQVFGSTLRQGLAWSAGLLVVGLAASGLLAHRLTRPLRSLATGAEAISRGELGVQVSLTATGEVGELQRAFNRMSQRLQTLEQEREEWRRREHLAQLGDLARGLAHTLRNPLNTLGLATEELAAASGSSGEPLAATARAQIRRIDRWLRSFLALGAGEAAVPETADVGGVVQEVVLEAVQQGAAVGLAVGAAELPVSVVPTPLRAALANLLENAVQASPPGDDVTVTVVEEGGRAVVRIRDRGPGLPEEVRRRLFQPHVTTRVEGSGMGLFLARQLVGLNGGELELADAEDGGTVATVTLPLVARKQEAGHAC